MLKAVRMLHSREVKNLRMSSIARDTRISPSICIPATNEADWNRALESNEQKMALIRFCSSP